MMTRAQHATVERLSLAHVGEPLAIRDGFTDEHIDVTAEGGKCWAVSAEGVLREQGPNHSIHWKEVNA